MTARWLVLAAPAGGVLRLGRGGEVWELDLFEPGLPVCVRAPDGELRVLHEGGFFAGWSLPVPQLAPELRAGWLARAIGGRLYRSAAGFAAAIERYRREDRTLREAGQAWVGFDVPRLPGPAILPLLAASTTTGACP